MAHIDYYLGTISPWCYLAGDRLEQIAAKHGASVTYRPLDVLQLFDRTGGTRGGRSRDEHRGKQAGNKQAHGIDSMGNAPSLPRRRRRPPAWWIAWVRRQTS